MATFMEYLQSLKADLSRLGPNIGLYLTSGNETCDLDSIASSLVYAHYTASRNCHSTADSDDDVDYMSLPLLQCCRDDLVMNQEVVYIFHKLGIDDSSLVFLDDVSMDVLSSVDNLSVIMVDHNAPTGMMVPLSSSVTKVIDHHQISNNTVADSDGVTSTIEMVGSCASLIAQEVIRDESYIVDESVATLLLSAIILDTGNLKAAGRVTDTDKSVVEELVKFLPSSFCQDDLFADLINARFNISKLPARQALRKDYKECTVGPHIMGFSSITGLLSDFLIQPNIKQDLMNFYSEHKLDALIILGVHMADPTTTSIQRQIAIFQPESTNSEFSDSIVSLLEASDKLCCERLDSFPDFEGVVLNQANVEMSRKQIIPLVTSFVASVESEFLKPSLSPSNINVETKHTTDSTAEGLSVASAQPYPLEPTITVLTNPSDGNASPPCTTLSSAHVVQKGRTDVNVIPEYSSTEECKDRRSHLLVSVGGEETTISMELVEPYKKVVQHAGYIGESRQALVVISASYLPPKSLPNYNHVVHHAFFYVLSVLDKLIVDDYTIVYIHSGAPRNSMPSINVLHRFYKMIDRRMRKQLTHLYIVHPTFWVKTMLRLSRPFISKKFWRKVHFTPTLQDLPSHIKIEDYISAPVAAMDKLILSKRPAQQKYMTKNDSQKASASGKKKANTEKPSEASGGDKNVDNL